MMNNHGWGLRDMIIFSSIIVIALALVYMLINNLYKELEGPSNTQSYSTIEKNLANAAKKYFSIRANENVKPYDNIVLNASEVEENQTLY